MNLIEQLSAGSSGIVDADQSASPHVLLVLDQFPKTLGGGERIVLKLAALLPAFGYRASILTFSVHPESSGASSSPCPVYLLPLTRTYDLQAMRSAFALRQFLTQQHVQIVQTFFESSDIWAGAVVKAMSQVKLVWSRRDMGILRTRKHHIAYRLMRDLPDAVFAVSDQVRRHCIEVDGIDPRVVTTVYNGLDLSGWTDACRVETQSGRRTVTTVGNIRRVKGHDIFIRAAADVRRQFPDVSFTIAGEVLERDYFEELEQLVDELSLSDTVRFVGGISDLHDHLCSADLFVLPSRSEGFSNAIIEAMAASLPVIATDVGGNAEAVEDQASGLIIPPEDPAALAEAMTRLLSDRSLAKRMGEAGRHLAVTKFTSNAMLQQITHVYSDLLGQEV